MSVQTYTRAPELNDPEQPIRPAAFLVAFSTLAALISCALVKVRSRADKSRFYLVSLLADSAGMSNNLYNQSARVSYAQARAFSGNPLITHECYFVQIKQEYPNGY